MRQWTARPVCRQQICTYFLFRHTAMRRTATGEQAWNEVRVIT